MKDWKRAPMKTRGTADQRALEWYIGYSMGMGWFVGRLWKRRYTI